MEITPNRIKEIMKTHCFPNRSTQEPRNGLMIIAAAIKKVVNNPATEEEVLNSWIAADGSVVSRA